MSTNQFKTKKVWVNGTFDVLHMGHIRLLEYANQFGNVKVGLDTDRRISEKKGKDRPFNNLKDRMDFIQSIRYVESVTFFDSDDELRDRIREWEPDIMVIGGEYRYKEIIGCEYVPKIEFFEKIDGYSSTKILNYENNSNR
jgi:D-beta-D-heptose 7-phosphate kinase/D-beta-D-heptose 1-phosphate adenosyltransferase